MGILGLDGLVELLIASGIGTALIEEVLIADLDIVQRERLGMTVAYALRTPFGVGSARDILDLVECVLDETIDIVGRQIVSTERVTGEDGKDRLGIPACSCL